MQSGKENSVRVTEKLLEFGAARQASGQESEEQVRSGIELAEVSGGDASARLIQASLVESGPSTQVARRARRPRTLLNRRPARRTLAISICAGQPLCSALFIIAIKV